MADIPGKYIHKKSASHFIELKSDGSYILFDGATTLTGTYEVNGSDIAISTGESVSRGKIQNGVIIDDEGEKWVQPVKRRERSTEDPLASMLWLPAVLRREDFPWEFIDAVFIIAIFLLLARP